MRLALLLGLTFGLALQTAATRAACIPIGDGDDTGCVPPDKPTLSCEDRTSKAIATLTTSLVRCNVKDSDDKFRHAGDGSRFGGAACQDKARGKFDSKTGGLPGCPPCLDRAGLRDLATNLVNANGAVVFCDPNGRQCNDSACVQDPPNTGFVPPNTAAQKCEDATANAASRLAVAIIRCHVRTADARFRGTAFDEEACEASAKRKFDRAAAKLTTCPVCLNDPGQNSLRDLVETSIDANNGGAYCSGAEGGTTSTTVATTTTLGPTSTTLPGTTTTTHTSTTVVASTTSTSTTTSTVPGPVRCCVQGSAGGALDTCVIETAAQCSSAGGTVLGPGSCTPNPCPPVTTTTSTSSTSTSTSVPTSTTAPTPTTTSTTRPTSTSTTSTTSTTPTTGPTTTSTSTTTVKPSTSTSVTSTTTAPSTSTSVTSTTTAAPPTTSTTTPPASQLAITLAPATTNCGSAGLSTGPTPPFAGELDDGTGAKIVDLGLGCLYFGGGNNTAVQGAAIPDGSTTILDVTGSAGSTLTLGAHSGPATSCTTGVAATKHCGKASATACTADGDCGSNGPCVPDATCYFGPPLPIPNTNTPGLSSCVLNVVDTNASGSVDRNTGVANATIALSTRVYLTGTVYDSNTTSEIESCPRCISGTCNGGKNAGAHCVAGGPKLTSIDCPPTDPQFIAPLAVPLALKTAASASTAASGLFCPSQPRAGAFGRAAARTIRETGTPAGNLNDGAQHAAQLGTTFCVPKTGNGLIDPVADLPGPGATSIPTLLRLQ